MGAKGRAASQFLFTTKQVLAQIQNQAASVELATGDFAMDIGKVGVWAMLEGMTAPETLDFARALEKKGYRALWIPEGPGRDPFAHAAYLLSHTTNLVVATGIANIWARDAVAMASASRTVAEISQGRFVLGIGVSHKPVLAARGHSYDKPYSYMKEYLPQLKSALQKAPWSGEQIPILIAALHPKMLDLAATETNGTHPYFVPPEHTAKVRKQIGPNPWICVEQAVILEADSAKARAAARQHMSFYVANLPNYRNNLKALGWKDADFENGCSDALVDAIVAWGGEAKIRERIEAHFKAGATHVCIQALRADGKPTPDLRAVEALASR
jgi:probable F420-dependent oxidoreductase